MAEIKFLDKAGLTQVISHLQQDTDEKIAQAIEDAIFAGDSDENVDNLPYLDAEKLNGYTSDDFVKVADLGTTTVGLATADAEGNIISSTYAKNSDMNSGFVSLQSQIDNKVDKTTTVNGKALSSNIAITAADVGADAQGTAANALKEAKTYAEGQASSALTSAKAYTDTEATSVYSAAKTYAEEQAASALKSAKTYADTASATALSDAKEYNDTAYANANAYTDKKIADLINGAPTTLDTLGEIATAMNNNADVVEALNEAIGTKANSADLANYLPLSGGDVYGNVVAKSDSAEVRGVHARNSVREIGIQVLNDGTARIIDNNGTLVNFPNGGGNTFNGTATGNLPLTGGTLSGKSDVPLVLQGTSETTSMIKYKAGTTDLGYMGFEGVDTPIVYSPTLNTRKLLHTGNVGDYALPISGGTMKGHIKLPTGTTIRNNNDKPILEYRGSDSDSSGTRVGDYNDRMVLLTSGNDLWHYNRTVGKDGLILDTLNYSDYALPLTGGTVNGAVTISNNNNISFRVNNTGSNGSFIAFSDANGTKYLGCDKNGVPKYSDGNNELPLLHSGNYTDYALPKSGGTIDGFVQINNASETPFVVHNSTSSTHCYVGFRAGGTELGYFGFQTGMPYVMSVNGSGVVLHSGNSAKVATSGSYNDLTDKPTIPTNTNQLTNGAGYITGITKSMVTTALGYTPPTSDTNTWRPLGTTADTACAGNDARLSNARPASDVYSWAKASSKPSYTKAEVGLGNVDNTADSAKSVKYATSAGSANAVAWGNVSGKPSSYTPSSHNQAASTITAGTFGGAVVAPASTAYTTNQLRNGVFTTTDPGAGASSSYANGSIIYVYE